jgi:hypothetical protein
MSGQAHGDDRDPTSDDYTKGASSALQRLFSVSGAQVLLTRDEVPVLDIVNMEDMTITSSRGVTGLAKAAGNILWKL